MALESSGASAATLDDVIERLDAIQRDNAAIRKENAAMRREIAALRKERAIEAAEVREVVSSEIREAVAASTAPSDFTSFASAHAAGVSPVGESGPYDWSGFYVGTFAGYGGGKGDWSPMGLNGVPVDAGLGLNVRGGLAGVHAGLDYQAGNLVLGTGASLAWAGIGKRSSHEVPTAIISEELETNINWTGSVTGRLGYAFDNVLVYAKGGAAVAGVDDRLTISTATGRLAGHQQSTVFGWTAGAGAELAFGRNWSAGLEYAYSDFGSRSVALSEPMSFTTFTHDIDTKLHLVKAGMSYRFGGN